MNGPFRSVFVSIKLFTAFQLLFWLMQGKTCLDLGHCYWKLVGTPFLLTANGEMIFTMDFCRVNGRLSASILHIYQYFEYMRMEYEQPFNFNHMFDKSFEYKAKSLILGVRKSFGGYA
jgi:hypothetical protein